MALATPLTTFGDLARDGLQVEVSCPNCGHVRKIDGASPLKAFVKVTVPLMLPGIIAGAMMSFITAINELSSTLLLYTARTATMPVRIYSAVLDGEFGIAAALSTILLVSSGVCVYVVLRFSQSRESAFV